MVVTFIIHSMLSLIQTVLGVLPNVPATPQAVIDGGTWIVNQVAGVVSLLNVIFSSTLMTATIVIVVAMFTFEWIYHTVMWIVRKIPMINVK